MNLHKYKAVAPITSAITALGLCVGSVLLSFQYPFNPKWFNFTFNVEVSLFLLSIYLTLRFLTTKYLKHTNVNSLVLYIFYATLIYLIAFLLGKGLFVLFFQEQSAYINLWKIYLFLITAIYLANTFFCYKRTILYLKTNLTITLWDIFEMLVFLSILTSFFLIKTNTIAFILITIPITLLGLILTFNVKWVPFLNLQQKITAVSIQLLSLAFLVCTFYLIYLEHLKLNSSFNIIDIPFLVANAAFVVLNFVVISLILIFNLPTSSVFQQKINEVNLFQKLQQTIRLEGDIESIYMALLESCSDSAMASGAWIEVNDDQGHITAFKTKGVDHIDAFNYKTVLRKNKLIKTGNHTYIKDLRTIAYNDKIKKLKHRSLLLLPLLSGNDQLGVVVLLTDKPNGFDTETIELVLNFMSQASIAIKNSQLMDKALETERYLEEMKIAKRIQALLLPTTINVSSHIEIATLSQSAADIGGDYYDYFTAPNGDIYIAIGDVSGHGTSAAFNMAQVKGIFHTLSQLGLSSVDFLDKANNAIATCFDKKVFLQFLLVKISEATKTVEITRAGHCYPVFFQNQFTHVIKSKGVGLGLIRGKSFAPFIESVHYTYNPGDQLLLYTDGLIEASNSTGEQFGLERLIEIVKPSSNNLPLFLKAIFNQCIEFSGKPELEDDGTIVLIKFH
jgi:sigma-B regulation protein RsbU (phosphoserine phosphatase)